MKTIKRHYEGIYSDQILARKENWHLLKCINKEVFHSHLEKLVEVENLGWGNYIYECTKCKKKYELTEGSQDTEGHGSYIEI